MNSLATVAIKESMETTETKTGTAGLPLAPERLLAAAKQIDAALRDGICDQWMYANYGDYPTFEDYPPSTKSALLKAAESVLSEAANDISATTGQHNAGQIGGCARCGCWTIEKANMVIGGISVMLNSAFWLLNPEHPHRSIWLLGGISGVVCFLVGYIGRCSLK